MIECPLEMLNCIFAWPKPLIRIAKMSPLAHQKITHSSIEETLGSHEFKWLIRKMGVDLGIGGCAVEERLGPAIGKEVCNQR